MPITFTTVRPRRLISADVRLGNTGNWVNIPHCEYAAWRPATILATDFAALTTTANMKLYKPTGVPRGFGRSCVGVLWCRDPHVIEELVHQSHLNSTFGAEPLVNTDLSLRYVFNTGLNTTNFRVCYKSFSPVIVGVGWSMVDWLFTLQKPDGGAHGLFACPWQLAVNLENTGMNATNVNVAGIYTTFANSS
jgi:hypothetical protein